MQETHDLRGWALQFSREWQLLKQPEQTEEVLHTRVLHITNITHHIRHLIDMAIHQWDIKQQFEFFYEHSKKHTALHEYGKILSAKALDPHPDLKSIVAVMEHFSDKIVWFLRELKKPEWQSESTIKVFASKSTAELEALPLETLHPKNTGHRASHTWDQAR